MNTAQFFRAGFVTFVGRPNVGKSTLMNALVGEKIAITSNKPQTTRRAIRGLVHMQSGQLIIVDTPGVHRPRTLLGERLGDVTDTVLGDVDVIGLCFPANEPIGAGDRFIVAQSSRFPRAQKVAIVTKTDTVSRVSLAGKLQNVSELADWVSIVPVSATGGFQLETLRTELLALMPVSPPLYPLAQRSDETPEQRYAELIREAALLGAREELPHSLAVTIDDIVSREDRELVEIYASLWVERDSQKGIVIGRGGERLRAIGESARVEIEALIHAQVFLSLRVKVAPNWQKDARQLRRLGF